MFALLPLWADEVRVLRERDGIYIDAAGRIKIADLNEANFDRFTSTLTPIDVIQAPPMRFIAVKANQGVGLLDEATTACPHFVRGQCFPLAGLCER